MKKIIIPSIIVLLVFITFFSSFYTVKEHQTAVIETFGAPTSTQTAGPHFKLPFGIQKVRKVNSNITQQLTIGYGHDKNGQLYVVPDESLMITGDYNIVNIDFFLEWKISDPIAYLYNSNNPQIILKSIAQAAERNIVGSKKVDDVLTSGKGIIESEIEELIRTNLEIYDIGIQLIDVKIQDSEPPTSDVRIAFDAVESARQNQDTYTNDAKSYQNEQIPAAQADADKIVKDAEAYKEARIQEAMGEVAKFNEIFTEYSNFKEITRTRMYLETIEKIFPNVNIYISTSDSGVSTLLPLETFSNTTINGGN